jgi:hypothetical protein
MIIDITDLDHALVLDALIGNLKGPAGRSREELERILEGHRRFDGMYHITYLGGNPVKLL